MTNKLHRSEFFRTDRLIARRKECGLKAVELAALLGITKVHMSRIEHGASGVTLDMLVSLSEALNCSTDWLVGKTNSP